MSKIYNWIYTLWNSVTFAISGIRITDVLDILICAYIVYKLISFAKDSRAGQLLKGLIIIVGVYFISNWFNFPIMRSVMSIFINSIFVLLIIVFQPELRRVLEKVGSSSLRPGQFFNSEYEAKSVCIENVCKAAGTMQDSKIGALIVFERNTLLGDIINTGTTLDAVPSVSIINNIFFPKSPLHDGAVVIRDDRIYAAGCILPLSENHDISSSLGTRHRAAIGMSENSDAVVLVVSEETGSISIAVNGRITSGFSAASATLELKNLLIVDKGNEDKSLIKGIKKRIKQGKKQ